MDASAKSGVWGGVVCTPQSRPYLGHISAISRPSLAVVHLPPLLNLCEGALDGALLPLDELRTAAAGGGTRGRRGGLAKERAVAEAEAEAEAVAVAEAEAEAEAEAVAAREPAPLSPCPRRPSWRKRPAPAPRSRRRWAACRTRPARGGGAVRVGRRACQDDLPRRALRPVSRRQRRGRRARRGGGASRGRWAGADGGLRGPASPGLRAPADPRARQASAPP